MLPEGRQDPQQHAQHPYMARDVLDPPRLQHQHGEPEPLQTFHIRDAIATTPRQHQVRSQCQNSLEVESRGIADFCSVDDRLLPVGYVPLMSIERACSFVGDAIESGAAALMVASACPRTHSPSHVGLDPVGLGRRRSRDA